MENNFYDGALAGLIIILIIIFIKQYVFETYTLDSLLDGSKYLIFLCIILILLILFIYKYRELK